jgi:hypothetical protein
MWNVFRERGRPADDIELKRNRTANNILRHGFHLPIANRRNSPPLARNPRNPPAGVPCGGNSRNSFSFQSLHSGRLAGWPQANVLSLRNDNDFSDDTD